MISIYADFKVSAPVIKPSIRANTPRAHVSIQCPYCSCAFGETLQDQIGHKKSGMCIAHLQKCQKFALIASGNDAQTVLVHGKCILERKTLQEQLNHISRQMDEQREETKKQRELMQTDLKQQTADIITHFNSRWSTFASVMESTFPSLRQPVTEETIPVQLKHREQTLMKIGNSALEDAMISIKDLKTENAHLTEMLAFERNCLAGANAEYKTLESKFKSLARKRV